MSDTSICDSLLDECDLNQEFINDEAEVETGSEEDCYDCTDSEDSLNKPEDNHTAPKTAQDIELARLQGIVTEDTPIEDSKVKAVALAPNQVLLLEAYKLSIDELHKEEDPIIQRYKRNLIQAKFCGQLGFTVRDIDADIRDAGVSVSSLDIKSKYTLDEILNSVENTDNWIIPRLLFSCGLYLLVAAPKGFKSRLCYEIAHSICISGMFLGDPATKGKVLFYQCEEPKNTIANNLITRGFNDNEKDFEYAVENNSLVISRSFNIKTGLSALEDEIKSYKPTLVIFDSLRAISASIETSENSAEFAKYLYALQRLLVINDVCGLVLHHANKGGQAGNKTSTLNKVAGSLALTGATDGIIFLEQAENSTKDVPLISLVTVPRNTAPIELTLSYRKREGGRWYFQKEAEVGLDEELYLVEQQILRYMSQNLEPLTKHQICIDIGLAVNDPDVDQTLTRLTESMLINTSYNRKDRKFRYMLPEKSPWINHFSDEDKVDDSLVNTLLGDEQVNKLFTDGSFLSTESKIANDIIKCTTKKEIDLALAKLAKGQHVKVWRLLTIAEKNKVQKILNPPVIADGFTFTFEGKQLEVESSLRNFEKHSYDYTLTDGSVLIEGVLVERVYGLKLVPINDLDSSQNLDLSEDAGSISIGTASTSYIETSVKLDADLANLDNENTDNDENLDEELDSDVLF